MTTTVSYGVKSRQIAPLRVATIREPVPITALGRAMGRGFVEVVRAIESAGAEIDGLPFAIHHITTSEEVDVELGFPVIGEVEVGRVHTTVLDGGLAACAVHQGPYEEVGAAYDAVSSWVQLHGKRVIGPPREVYLNEPGEGVVPITEVQMMLA